MFVNRRFAKFLHVGENGNLLSRNLGGRECLQCRNRRIGIRVIGIVVDSNTVDAEDFHAFALRYEFL